MQQGEVKELLRRYSAGTATAEEKALVEAWYEQFDTSEQIINEVHLQSLENEVFMRLPVTHPSLVRRLLPRLIAAASVVAVVSFGGYFLLHKKVPSQQIAQNQTNDIKPGGNKAVLTLYNGQKISLTDAKNGRLATQANTIVKKTADGKLVYSDEQNGTASPGNAVQYNTLTTPRGGHYEATLSDGTHFILDAASSIRYPVKFAGHQRLVEVTGQVYFEVKYNRAQPFKVTARNQIVEDLGTVFNINAYDNEPRITTTLLEGGIKVSNKGQSSILKPGQQAVIASNSDAIKISNVDTDEAFAWKDGYFMFHQADIGTMMRQLERWYDVDVAYEGQNPTVKITGKVHRNVNASQALKILTYLDIHYRIDGKKIIITP